MHISDIYLGQLYGSDIFNTANHQRESAF